MNTRYEIMEDDEEFSAANEDKFHKLKELFIQIGQFLSYLHHQLRVPIHIINEILGYLKAIFTTVAGYAFPFALLEFLKLWPSAFQAAIKPLTFSGLVMMFFGLVDAVFEILADLTDYNLFQTLRNIWRGFNSASNAFIFFLASLVGITVSSLRLEDETDGEINDNTGAFVGPLVASVFVAALHGLLWIRRSYLDQKHEAKNADGENQSHRKESIIMRILEAFTYFATMGGEFHQFFVNPEMAAENGRLNESPGAELSRYVSAMVLAAFCASLAGFFPNKIGHFIHEMMAYLWGFNLTFKLALIVAGLTELGFATTDRALLGFAVGTMFFLALSARFGISKSECAIEKKERDQALQMSASKDIKMVSVSSSLGQRFFDHSKSPQSSQEKPQSPQEKKDDAEFDEEITPAYRRSSSDEET